MNSHVSDCFFDIFGAASLIGHSDNKVKDCREQILNQAAFFNFVLLESQEGETRTILSQAFKTLTARQLRQVGVEFTASKTAAVLNKLYPAEFKGLVLDIGERLEEAGQDALREAYRKTVALSARLKLPERPARPVYDRPQVAPAAEPEVATQSPLQRVFQSFGSIGRTQFKLEHPDDENQAEAKPARFINIKAAAGA